MMDQHLPASFLCHRHREWLRHRPREALLCWQRSTEEAQRQLARGDRDKALRFAGCALETAQLMVRDARHCDSAWLRRHASSQGLFELLIGSLGPATPGLRPHAAAVPLQRAGGPVLH
jgi:hypothetical protein